MKHVFVINPTAGKGKAVQMFAPKIEEYKINHPEFDYEIYITKGAGDGLEYVKRITSKDEKMRIYAVGGDGTLFEVANGAFGKKNIEIGCIPCGSGNDYIRLFGSTQQMQDIPAQINGTSVLLDSMRCGEYIAVNQCSMGMDAETCNKQNDFKKLKFLSGSASYVAAILYCFLYKMDNKFTIKIDDEKEFTSSVLFCFAGNSRWYGGGFMAAPFAMPDDGLLDIVIVKKEIPKIKLLRYIKPYKEGRMIGHNFTIFKRAKKVTISSPKPATVNIDGECIQADSVTFELVPKSFRFIVPTSSDYLKRIESGETSNKIDFEKYKF